jgi:hypothetical protein
LQLSVDIKKQLKSFVRLKKKLAKILLIKKLLPLPIIFQYQLKPLNAIPIAVLLEVLNQRSVLTHLLEVLPASEFFSVQAKISLQSQASTKKASCTLQK